MALDRFDEAKARLRAAIPARDYRTPREVAELVGISYDSVLRAIRRGDLPAFRPSPNVIRIRQEDLDAWYDTTRVEPPERPEPRPPGRSRPRARRGSVTALRKLEKESEAA